MTVPRILTIMGSGETSPTMVKTHRQLLARLGPGPAAAVLIDTPFGFQANAADLVAKAQDYFRESVGNELGLVSFRSAGEADPLSYETALVHLRAARYVFAGPGSPSYALRHWSGSLIPKILGEKLTSGGCVTFASAAALTLGRVTVPVYEIYKVGEPPRWLDGLNLMAETGLNVAVIPHYNNAEGGTHDTRYCYLGEPRLRLLEKQLAEADRQAFVLGVDEHTAVIFDLEAGQATVAGLGTVTVRASGRSSELTSGAVLSIGDLEAIAGDLRATTRPVNPPSTAPPEVLAPPVESPLVAAIAQRQSDFDAALAAGIADGAVGAILGLEDDLHAWSRDSLQSDEADRGRAALRSMIVRLGQSATAGLRDPAEVIGPFVDALLDQRQRARQGERWGDADAVRDRLVDLGIAVHDQPDGTTWTLEPGA